ncbi:hypothetical protein [Agrococcus jejuensis]|uniref:hypothetical protein n=1 Tax=Agrococcus jejuensis TaxID=399736 RepID=UPI0011A66343|nr:hypothetical protein [Agrococcus jejuensis]
MTTAAAEAIAWRASAARVAGHGWVLGAAGSGIVALAAGVVAAVQASQRGPIDGWSLVFVGLFVLLGVAPVGGTGGLWAAAIVLAVRGARPARRRRARIARLAIPTALIVGVLATIVMLVDIGAMAGADGPVPAVALATIGALATARIIRIADRAAPCAPRGEPQAEWTSGATAVEVPLREPFVLGACLGPIALSAAPLIASLDPGTSTPIVLTNAGILACFGIGLGPVVGLGFAAVVLLPWAQRDEWPRALAGRIAALVLLQVASAALLGGMAYALLGMDEAAARAAIGGGLVSLVTELTLLVVGWRSHARHAADLSRSR